MSEGLINGRLENWHSEQRTEDYEFMLFGNVYDHGPDRYFEDGERVHTSLVIAPPGHVFKEGDIVQTRNSRYLLGKSMGDVLKDLQQKEKDNDGN